MIVSTKDFWKMLDEGRLDEAENMLQSVGANREAFSRYDDDWLRDRRLELENARAGTNYSGQASRSKDDAKTYLLGKYGFSDTAGFRECLKGADVEKAKAWLQEIISDPAAFPQYHRTWGTWVADREREIETEYLKKATRDILRRGIMKAVVVALQAFLLRFGFDKALHDSLDLSDLPISTDDWKLYLLKPLPPEVWRKGLPEFDTLGEVSLWMFEVFSHLPIPYEEPNDSGWIADVRLALP